MSWQWIIEESLVPICTVDVNTIPCAGEILGVKSKAFPLIIVQCTTTGACFQKPCTNCVDVASQTLFPPVMNKAQLDECLLSSSADGEANSDKKHDLVVAYVGAAWCPPCVKIMPHLPEFSRSVAKNAKFVKIDFDAGKELVEAIGIQKIPTFCAFDLKGNNDSAKEYSSSSAGGGVQMPFGSLQHSDPVRVSEQMRKWCDLAESKNQVLSGGDMFTNDDF